MEMPNQRIRERMLEEIVRDNASLLGKPIASKTLLNSFLKELSDKDKGTIIASIGLCLFNEGVDESYRDIIVKREQFLRNLFSRRGLPHFVVTYHSPECVRDVFLTFKSARDYTYCFSFYPLNYSK